MAFLASSLHFIPPNRPISRVPCSRNVKAYCRYREASQKQLLLQNKYSQPLVSIQIAHQKQALPAGQMQMLSFVVAVTLSAHSLCHSIETEYTPRS